MLTKLKSGRGGRWLQGVCVGLCYLAQVGCGGESTNTNAGYYRRTGCSPTEVVTQLQEAFSSNRIRTLEPNAEGKGFSILTDSMMEQRGRRERSVKYRVVVQPFEDDGHSTIRLERLEDKSKGMHERKWYEEEQVSSEPQSEQKVWEQIQGVCRK